jgi:SAM-dependent methyltransferase
LDLGICNRPHPSQGGGVFSNEFQLFGLGIVMSDWTSGYVADIGYTFGYYQELNPQRVKLAFLNSGLVCPEFGNACELGFGQGMSANIHAAASLCSWHGTDFNPEQASFAQELASTSGANAHLYDESFAAFAQRDLPEFDYIGLHGIWSWISDENRQIIVDFVKKRLKVGGVLYISYNTLPGWGPFMPMRHLMVEHAQVMSAEGAGILGKIEGALSFSEKLLATKPAFANNNSDVSKRIEQLKKHNKSYVAHEYFNRDWHPMYFSDISEYLESAKLSYACSAGYQDGIDEINLSKEQQILINEIQDKKFKEGVRDYLINQQFRRDYWVKGLRKINPLQRKESIKKLNFILVKNPDEISLKIKMAQGEATLSEHIYKPLIQYMADHSIRCFSEIEQSMIAEGIFFDQLVQAVFILSGIGAMATVQEPDIISKAKLRTDKLNTHLIDKSRGSNEFLYLASPVTGGGVSVGRFQQLFVLAIIEGIRKPEEWAGFVASILDAQGQKIVKEGKKLETRTEIQVELEGLAHKFASKQLPVLKALQIL